MKLQDKILQLRKKSGLSQEALAEKIGLEIMRNSCIMKVRGEANAKTGIYS